MAESRFRIRVIVDPDTRGLKGVERGLGRIENAADRVRKTIGSALAVGGITVGLGAATRNLAQFEQSISTIGAVTGGTTREVAALREEAQRLGATTRFSATQAAEGITFLARAGFSAQEALEGVEDTLLLAQAGALDLGSAADIASNVLQGFRLQVKDLANVTDVLAFTANNSNTNVQQLGDAMKFVAPVAAGLNVSIEQASAAIGALSNAGLQASLAGTGLRRVLAELESPSEKTAKLLNNLKISTDAVKVSEVGLIEALKVLNSEVIDTGLALEIFGDRGGPAFEILQSATGDVEKMAEVLADVDGVARRTAKTMDDNLQGSILALKSAFEALILATGEKGVTGELRLLVDFLTDVVRELAGVEAEVKTNETAVKAFVGALKGLLFALSALLIIKGVTAALAAFNVAMAAGTAATVGFTVATGNATAALTFLGAAFKALPIGVLLILLSTLIGIILELTGAMDKLKELFGGTAEEADKTTEAMRRLERQSRTLKEAEVTFVTAQRLGDLEREREALEDLIRSREDAIFELQKEITERGGPEAPAARAAVQRVAQLDAATDKLRTQLEDLNTEIEKNAQVEEKAKEEADEFSGAIEGLLANLEEEAKLIGLSSEQRRIQTELLRIERDLRKEGITLQDEEREAVEQRLQQNAQLERQAKILQDLRGAQDEQLAQQSALNELYRSGRITLEEFTAELEKLKTKASESANAANESRMAFDSVIAGLQEERDLLSESAKEREIRNQLIEIENDLKKKGVDLLPEQLEQLELELRTLQAAKGRQEVIDSIKGPQEEQAERQRILNELVREGIITTDQYHEALEKLGIKAEETGKSLGDAFGGALETIEQRVGTLADVLESSLVKAFDTAAQAITNFVIDGKGDIKSLARSLIADVTRMIVQLLLLQAIKTALGIPSAPVPGGGGGLPVPRQEGGPVDPTRAFLVGENGPEIFQPATAGRIIPTEKTAAMMGGGQPVIVQAPPPVVNLSVNNFSDPEEVGEFLDTPTGEQKILNVLARNPDAVKRSVG